MHISWQDLQANLLILNYHTKPNLPTAPASDNFPPCIFSCPEQLNRTHCPSLGPPAPPTIRVFTTLQSDPRVLWPLRHLSRLVDDNFWWQFLMAIFDDNFWWQFPMTTSNDNFWWQFPMTISYVNLRCQFLITIFDDNFLDLFSTCDLWYLRH